MNPTLLVYRLALQLGFMLRGASSIWALNGLEGGRARLFGPSTRPKARAFHARVVQRLSPRGAARGRR